MDGCLQVGPPGPSVVSLGTILQALVVLLEFEPFQGAEAPGSGCRDRERRPVGWLVLGVQLREERSQFSPRSGRTDQCSGVLFYGDVPNHMKVKTNIP